MISGAYKDWQFRAFTYHFVGNTLEQTGPGGVFSVVMIQCPQAPQVQLPEQVFYENGNEELNQDKLLWLVFHFIPCDFHIRSPFSTEVLK